MYSDQSHACSYDTCSSILVDQCLFFCCCFLAFFCVVHPKACRTAHSVIAYLLPEYKIFRVKHLKVHSSKSYTEWCSFLFACMCVFTDSFFCASRQMVKLLDHTIMVPSCLWEWSTACDLS